MATGLDRLPTLVKDGGEWQNVFSYHPFDVKLDRAEGIYLYDDQGNRYIDVTGGPLAVNLPHGDPRMIKAISDQVQRYAYCHPFMADPKRAELANAMAEVTPGDLNESFMVCGGSEAVETAIKLARQYHIAKGNRTKHKIISVHEAYHGMTMATMALAGNPGYRIFEPMMPPKFHIDQYSDFNKPDGMDREEWAVQSAQELERRIHWEGASSVAAFLATPWGCGSEYGVMAPPIYWQEIRRICDEYDVLLIADEVVSGFGRSGRWFCMEHHGVQADLMTVAKGITGCNVPAGAVCISDRVAAPFHDGSYFLHGFTFQGHPLSCAAGLASLQILKEDNLVENSFKVGEHLHTYRDKLLSHTSIADVRGRGLFMAMELVGNPETREFFGREQNAEEQFQALGLKNGLMFYSALYGARRKPLFRRGLPMMVTPPLSITREQVDDLMERLDQTLSEWEASFGIG